MDGVVALLDEVARLERLGADARDACDALAAGLAALPRSGALPSVVVGALTAEHRDADALLAPAAMGTPCHTVVARALAPALLASGGAWPPALLAAYLALATRRRRLWLDDDECAPLVAELRSSVAALGRRGAAAAPAAPGARFSGAAAPAAVRAVVAAVADGLRRIASLAAVDPLVRKGPGGERAMVERHAADAAREGARALAVVTEAAALPGVRAAAARALPPLLDLAPLVAVASNALAAVVAAALADDVAGGGCSGNGDDDGDAVAGGADALLSILADVRPRDGAPAAAVLRAITALAHSSPRRMLVAARRGADALLAAADGPSPHGVALTAALASEFVAVAAPADGDGGDAGAGGVRAGGPPWRAVYAARTLRAVLGSDAPPAVARGVAADGAARLAAAAAAAAAAAGAAESGAAAVAAALAVQRASAGARHDASPAVARAVAATLAVCDLVGDALAAFTAASVHAPVVRVAHDALRNAGDALREVPPVDPVAPQPARGAGSAPPDARDGDGGGAGVSQGIWGMCAAVDADDRAPAPLVPALSSPPAPAAPAHECVTVASPPLDATERSRALSPASAALAPPAVASGAPALPLLVLEADVRRPAAAGGTHTSAARWPPDTALRLLLDALRSRAYRDAPLTAAHPSPTAVHGTIGGVHRLGRDARDARGVAGAVMALTDGALDGAHPVDLDMPLLGAVLMARGCAGGAMEACGGDGDAHAPPDAATANSATAAHTVAPAAATVVCTSGVDAPSVDPAEVTDSAFRGRLRRLEAVRLTLRFVRAVVELRLRDAAAPAASESGGARARLGAPEATDASSADAGMAAAGASAATLADAAAGVHVTPAAAASAAAAMATPALLPPATPAPPQPAAITEPLARAPPPGGVAPSVATPALRAPVVPRAGLLPASLAHLLHRTKPTVGGGGGGGGAQRLPSSASASAAAALQTSPGALTDAGSGGAAAAAAALLAPAPAPQSLTPAPAAEGAPRHPATEDNISRDGDVDDARARDGATPATAAASAAEPNVKRGRAPLESAPEATGADASSDAGSGNGGGDGDGDLFLPPEKRARVCGPAASCLAPATALLLRRLPGPPSTAAAAGGGIAALDGSATAAYSTFSDAPPPTVVADEAALLHDAARDAARRAVVALLAPLATRDRALLWAACTAAGVRPSALEAAAYPEAVDAQVAWLLDTGQLPTALVPTATGENAESDATTGGGVRTRRTARARGIRRAPTDGDRSGVGSGGDVVIDGAANGAEPRRSSRAARSRARDDAFADEAAICAAIGEGVDEGMGGGGSGGEGGFDDVGGDDDDAADSDGAYGDGDDDGVRGDASQRQQHLQQERRHRPRRGQPCPSGVDEREWSAYRDALLRARARRAWLTRLDHLPYLRYLRVRAVDSAADAVGATAVALVSSSEVGDAGADVVGSALPAAPPLAPPQSLAARRWIRLPQPTVTDDDIALLDAGTRARLAMPFAHPARPPPATGVAVGPAALAYLSRVPIRRLLRAMRLLTDVGDGGGGHAVLGRAAVGGVGSHGGARGVTDAGISRTVSAALGRAVSVVGEDGAGTLGRGEVEEMWDALSAEM